MLVQVQQRDTEISVLLGMLRTHGKGAQQESRQPACRIPLHEQASVTAPVCAGHPTDQALMQYSAVSGMALIAWLCIRNSLLELLH